MGGLSCDVALRKESVDRNTMQIVIIVVDTLSLSARRAWIEMRFRSYSQCPYWVALRKESVDRNKQAQRDIALDNVALRKESVDRNQSFCIFLNFLRRRSPQGERG